MKKTKIEWCDSTWNPVTGCRHECEYCYARRLAGRFGKRLADRSGYPEMHDGVHCLETKIKDNPYPYIFEPTFLPFKLNDPQRWTKPRTVFVCSMADLFGAWVPDNWIEAVFGACERAPQHRYLFLTKNPQRLCDLANAGKLPHTDNYWYGTSVTKMGDAVFSGGIRYNTFISIEPLLGPLDAGIGSFGSARWIIIGAETGSRKGKVKPEPEWIDNICEAAALTRATVFMKDSLVPIVREENMRREFPWNTKGGPDGKIDV